METLSLYDLNEYMRRVVALNFAEPIWLTCEISQCNDSRGNIYMDLVEKDEQSDKIIARSSAVIWYRTNLFLKKKLNELYKPILSQGTQVLIKVKVDFSEIYGMKLIIEDIDASYTMGQMEIQRQKIIEQLKKERLVHLNNLLSMPPVIQRIAIISSKTAAGYIDFIEQIKNNEYGYKYDLTLYNVTVQGQFMENEICNALREIDRNHEKFDVIAIIRGGGSKLDLSGFDSYGISERIARAKIPVITGIGHDVDDTIADLVSHTSVKTPTALATYLIDNNLDFESNLIDQFNRISLFAKSRYEVEKNAIELAYANLKLVPNNIIHRRLSQLDHIDSGIQLHISNSIKRMSMRLEHADKIIQLSNPTYMLEKGYVYLEKEGRVLKSTDSIQLGDILDIISENHILKVKTMEKESHHE